MNRDSMLELRVLSGTHAGARALLAASPQVIGSGENCALILSDEGVLAQHASLEHQADGSTVLRWLNSEMSPLIVRPGQGAQMGPVRVAIEQIDTPWREDVPILAPPPAQPSPQVSERRTGLSPNQVLLRTGAMLAVLALLGLVFWAGLTLLQEAPDAPQDIASSAGPAASSDHALALAIARLGLAGRVRIDRTDPQSPAVSVGFLPEEDMLALAQELSRLSPRPRLVRADESELVNAVTQAVQQLAGPGLPATARYLGNGRFRLEGRVTDEVHRARVIAQLEREFPFAAGFESNLTTQADGAAAMLEALRRQGLGRIHGEWTEGMLVLEVTLAPGDQVRWEQALLAVATRHDLPFRAQVRLQPGTQRPTAAELPFTIRSVVNSPLPHVTLSDGRKLMAGGRLDGWQLQEIGASHLVLDGPQGQRITMER